MSIPIIGGNGGSSKFIGWLAVANSIGIFALIAWMLAITFAAGERSNQLAVDTAAITDINVNGSSGTKARLDAIETRLSHIESLIDEMLMEDRVRRQRVLRGY